MKKKWRRDVAGQQCHFTPNNIRRRAPIDVESGHVTFHTKDSLTDLMKSIGFVNVTALEYLDDDSGSICASSDDSCTGRVVRSIKHDNRNIAPGKCVERIEQESVQRAGR